MNERRPDNPEAREEEAKAWLEQYYAFDDSGVEPEKIRKHLEESRVDNERNKEQEAENGWPETLEKLRAKPELTFEEYKAQHYHQSQEVMPEYYVDLNNWWSRFRPGTVENIQDFLNRGHVPHAYIYDWLKDGTLMNAFSNIGYDRSRQMIEDIRRCRELDKEYKQRLGQSPLGLVAAADYYRSLMEEGQSTVITNEELDELEQMWFRFENSLRVLALEMHDHQGVSMSSLCA